jgi:hypothetical protein
MPVIGAAPRFVLSPDGDVIDEYSGEAVYGYFPQRERMPFTVDGLTGEAALERLAQAKAALEAGRS